jgi:hypothetical protein
MARKQHVANSKPKTVLSPERYCLPDMEQSKNAVLNPLAAANCQEPYGHRIEEFITGYCSNPAHSTGCPGVPFFPEQSGLALATINKRSIGRGSNGWPAKRPMRLTEPDLTDGIRSLKGAI